ncbi:MAG: cyclic lactone autoinducer peptide [Lachnospiraceae bacterium]|nr:cyclic lactone autoinducer peptide [Lachnospiraceae bacterium]
MEKKKLSVEAAKSVKTALNIFLRVEANSASSVVAYQPKAPKELSRFKSSK